MRLTLEPTESPTRMCLEYKCTTTNLQNGWRLITLPMVDFPMFIPELGIVCYANRAERDKALERYGSGSNIVSLYYSAQMPFMQGSYKIMVNLSDRDYFFISGSNVYKLPKYSPEFRNKYISSANISSDKLETHDLIIVVTVLRHDSLERPEIVQYDDQFIPKNLKTREPILFVTNGLILFNDRSAAEEFIVEYNGDFVDYFIAKALAEVGKQHRDEMEDVYRKTREDKSAIMRNALLLAGTTVVGVVAEKVIQTAIVKKDPETITSIFKTIGGFAQAFCRGVTSFF